MGSGDDERSSKHQHRDKDKDRDRSSSRHHRDKDRERSSRHHRDDTDGDRDREREHRHREKERDREERKAREREERGREKEKEREKERAREEREREKEREKERAREEREREKEREKERAREEREREKEKERARRREERDRERSRRREADEEEDEDRDRKRRRRSSHHHHRDAEPEEPAPREEVDDEEAERRRQRKKEEDMEAEQQRLDDEMERRRRRVKEWQEKRREQQQDGIAASSSGATGAAAEADGGHKAGKKWTLDGEESDEEGDKEDGNKSEENGGAGDMDVDLPNGASDANISAGMEEDEIDPLDAFMNSMVLPEVAKLESTVAAMDSVPAASTDEKNNKSAKDVTSNGDKKGPKRAMGRIMQGDDSDSDYNDADDEAGVEDEDDEEFMKRVKKTKAEKLAIVDHSKIDYQPFRKNFYIEVKDITKMTSEEVVAYRKELELKVHGKDVPKPIKTWVQSGLTSKLLDTIKKLGFEKPMPIQTQALPIIMSGRDCIGIAKTGSGKTLAFVLPMLRHVKDQPPVVPGDGPIGLIMAPTRELVVQIHSDVKKFSKVLGINCVAIYGGSGVAQQISELKRGAEIVVCTPGRMIDILCTSSGKITNLRRVTFLVMDEADRMFDMGFEPQITRIVQNTRPDRQTVLFSATFPRQVEVLARKVLIKPVEIQVGGRSVVNKDIAQLVEVRPESERFFRLLELLGEWFVKGKILVFVHSQDKCDSLLKDLFQHGYPCLSLHGGKDQTDRESTIADFKSNVCSLLIATSVAARGLDVKELELVVNYDVPNHYEDYVHRVGRTGRAGRKGCAVTFISEEEERYTPDLVKALELSEQAVPEDLKSLADRFMAKVKQGTEQAHGTGYGGSGFKFNEEEDEARKTAKKAQAREYGYEEDKSDSDSDEEGGVRKAGGDLAAQAIANAQAAAALVANKAANNANQQITGTAPGPLLPILVASNQQNDEATARALQAAMNLQRNLAKIHANAVPEHYEAELEINDFPQNARWKITHKETLAPIQEFTGAAITTRGTYIPQGKIVGANERKLYLFIEGPTEGSVKKAKAELKRVLEDCANQALNLPGSAQTGKYSVI
ncbi:DEAD-box ATP-dependent RNA helicase 42-like [Phragmites australis]|uniref:DEAD-box ATP-dependent RNA helicase 42-like n=1 Tax=Phragmites australis TaxID=29695 RepID=UPI002D78A6CA|nr:DEAD-box ATP-dependent RNA helicase 42-like [Phragmites australis]XP_062195473.1 DEAD-box ATP-dependent RNA helicase 42-like [Phragmites australis]XP_062195474.1 DEAD-box ATP-dependent RNA helicase 42-like [Phragmites australis]XP_062195475.1 DEAD-box ATP-dependent RNA helicase 42-like [Phragmites australis]XP_062195476.1 DEAD-box ATP-dependent RNA helicase 42-like [Phragmites australis]XP_062195477.1 DEAD-box ATP-dependent RNA helicase 42-like [Phragmites australis]XP_062195478.1 DEAD-box